MGGMLRRCKTILGHNNLQVFTIKDITLEVNFIRPTNSIDVLVAIRSIGTCADGFDVEHFRYNKENDTYSCSNEILTTNGKWYNKTNGKSINR
jgi:hypothetical protein